ncbi:putative clathrin assembly protein [Camellia lanceoleosa]|uniref:Clathrin assembly protein n=1 Tax=Camellia lanceoleosa TaxID=1840588 RepID=A0ACC0J2U4_9ERIC|nr:putative clathrin assembly protein [Camellia lanceoleosa]
MNELYSFDGTSLVDLNLIDINELQVHYPLQAIQSVPFSKSKVQLLEAQRIRAVTWEACGDSGALQLLVDLPNMNYYAPKKIDLGIGDHLLVDKAVQEMESKCDQKLAECKGESRQYLMRIHEEHAALEKHVKADMGSSLPSISLWITWVSCIYSIIKQLREQQEVEEAEDRETLVDTQQETELEPKEEEVPPLISTDQTEDLLGLNEINPKAVEVKESNALALAIVPPGVNIVLNSHHHQSDENT